MVAVLDEEPGCRPFPWHSAYTVSAVISVFRDDFYRLITCSLLLLVRNHVPAGLARLLRLSFDVAAI